MPTVPTLQGRQVQQRGAPTPFQSPSEAGQITGAVGRGLGQASDAAFRIQQEETRRANQIAFQEFSRQYDEFELNALHDPENGLMVTRRGKAAMGLPGEVDDRLRELRAKLDESATSDAQRAALERLATDRENRIKSSVARHVRSEIESFERSSSDAKIRSARDLAAVHFREPATVQQMIAEQQAVISDQAAREGVSEEETKLLKDSAASSTHLSVIERALAADDFVYAGEYFADNKDDILGKDRAGVEAGIARSRARWEAQIVDRARLDINASLQDEKIGEARSKLESLTDTLPEGHREAFRQEQVAKIDQAERQKRNNDRNTLAEQVVSAVGAGLMPREQALEIAADGESRFAKNPDDDMGLDPGQVSFIRQAVKLEKKTETGADQLARRFGGDRRAPMPADEASRNRFVQSMLETGQHTPASLAQFFEREGQTLPSSLLGVVNDAFTVETLDLQTGLSVLEGVSGRTAGRIIGSLDNSVLARTAYEVTRGTDPGSQARQRALDVLSQPDARKWIERADTELVGDEKAGIEPIDKASAIIKHSGTPRQFSANGDVLLNLDTARRFDSLYRFHVARIAQSSGATSFDEVGQAALQAASREFANQAVAIRVPSPAKTTFMDPDLSTTAIALADGLGLGTLAKPNEVVINAFEEGLLDPELSDSFGMNPGFGWNPFNEYKGTVRPDLAFGLPGMEGKFIPVVENADPIGFVHWDGANMSSVDEKTPHNLLDTLRNVMSVGVDRLELVGDPRLRWRKDYGVPTIMEVPHQGTREALIDGIGARAVEQFRIQRGGRDPDLTDEADVEVYSQIMEQVAREHGWQGLGLNDGEGTDQ